MNHSRPYNVNLMSIVYENTEINFLQNLYVHIKTYQFALGVWSNQAAVPVGFPMDDARQFFFQIQMSDMVVM